jgi:sigma-B regulation protein RsbU (phosphoserine phosphatase)
MLPEELQKDLDAIAAMSAVPTLLKTIREWTGLRYTLVARVLPERWIACAVHDEIDFGLGVGGELDVATTLCSHVRDSHQPIVIEDVNHDPVYCGHPTPKMYNFQSYMAVPIFRRNGDYFGNVCGLDPLPRSLSGEKTLAMVQLFAELISLHLEADERARSNRIELDQQRTASRLREEFIAVLGHDVRNPLSAIRAGADLLLGRAAQGSADQRVLQRIHASTGRISALVDDLLDLARGRLGGGIALDWAEVPDLDQRVRQVVSELRASHPTRSIALEVSIAGPVRCDARRIEQLLSNLLGNAVQHGAAGAPVSVFVNGGGNALQIRVSNVGAPIGEDTLSQLFQPYFRGGKSTSGQGLGLGLFIVAEIAKSHGGRVDVASANGSTAFTFSMGTPPSPRAP